MVTLVKKIVFSGIDGRVLILPLLGLIWLTIGQVKDFVQEMKEMLAEGERGTSN